MGAYENPQAYIDTQTGQHFQRLQESIANTVAGVAQSYMAKQAELKKERDENLKILKANDMKAQEYSFSLYTDLAKSGAGDTSVNWAKTFDPLITESVALKTGLMNGNIPDKQGAIKRLAQIQASVDGVTGSLGDLSAAGSTYITALEKGIAVEGGLSSWNDPKITSAMDVLTQRLPGNKEPFFKDNDPTKLMWRVTDKNGAVLHEFDAEQLKKISKSQGLIKTIPSQITAFDSLKVSNTGVFDVVPAKVGDKEAPIPNGRVTNSFLVANDDGSPKQKEIVISKIGNKTTSKLVYEVDATKIGATLSDGLKMQAEGMLSDQSSAIDFYNEVIGVESGEYKGTGFNFDPRRPLDDAGKKKFVEDYKNYFVQTQIPKTQDVLKEDSSVVTNTVDTTKKDASSGGGGASSATTPNPTFSETQINSAAKNFNAIVAGKQVSFEVPIIGPRGGNNGALHFYREKGKIWNEETGMSFDSTEKLKQFLREKNQERERKPLTVSKK